MGVESLALLTNYFSIEDPTGFDPVDRELDMLEDLDGITIRGYSTASIATTTAVWSSPTTRRARRHPSDTPSAFFALKIYALLIRRRTGETPKELRLLYLNGPTMYKLDIDDRQLDAMDSQLRALWNAIDRALATRNFPTRPGTLCNWCSFKEICPAFTGTIASKGRSPHQLCVGHLADPLDEGGGPQVDVFVDGDVVDVAEGAGHDLPETGDHLVLGPEVLLHVLHPLEIGNSHAAGVGQDVGDDQDPSSRRMSSASRVVGPLAPSMMILAWISSALSRG